MQCAQQNYTDIKKVENQVPSSYGGKTEHLQNKEIGNAQKYCHRIHLRYDKLILRVGAWEVLSTYSNSGDMALITNKISNHP